MSAQPTARALRAIDALRDIDLETLGGRTLAAQIIDRETQADVAELRELVSSLEDDCTLRDGSLCISQVSTRTITLLRAVLARHSVGQVVSESSAVVALREIHALDLRDPDAGIKAANIAERALKL